MDFDIPSKHRKTYQRLNEPGHAHALTFSCFRRQPFLTKDRSRGWLIEGIARSCEKCKFDLWAYVIMPEHVHLLVCPREQEYSVSLFLKSLKQSVSKKALSYVREQAVDFLSRMKDLRPNGEVHYRFWQRGGGYDRNLTEPFTV